MHQVKKPASTVVWLAFLLNFIFSLFELIGGAMIGSQSVVANGLHDLSDAFFVGISWFLEKKSDQRRDNNYTYGYRRFSLLASLLSGILLIAGSLLIIAASFQRIVRGDVSEPTNAIFVFVAFGILINGASYFLTHRRHSHHEKMLSLHFLEDLAGWLFIFVGALITRLTTLTQVDVYLSIGLAIWIIWRGASQLKKVVQVLLQMSPGRNESVKARLEKFPEIKTIHHLHLWSMDGEHHILTSHLVLHAALSPPEISKFKSKLRAVLREDFSIADSTFEIEVPGEICLDEDCD